MRLGVKVGRHPLVLALFAFAGAGVFSTGCFPHDPEAIQIGHEACHTCKMTISDPRFGAEAILRKGKIVKFDSLECLVTFATVNQDLISNLYVLDFFTPGKLIPAEEAFFARSRTIHGPMGSTWIASTEAKKIESLTKPQKAELLRWSQIHLQGKHVAASHQ